MNSIYKIILITLVSVFLASFANPPPNVLFGLDIDPNKKIDTSMLYTIDPSTAIPTLVGDTGFRDCSALDFNPITNELFAVCRDDNFLDSILIKINPRTGAGEFIGLLNLNIQNLGFVRDISFRSDEVLFGYVAAKPNTVLGVIDTDTGNFTLVGSTGLTSGTGGLGFSLADVLFFAGFGPGDNQDLFILNQENASSTFVTGLNFLQNPPDPNFRSLDTNPSDGVLFGIYRNDSSIITLSTIDVDTGDVSNIGPTDDIAMTAIAFLPPRVTNIPALSQYGLILAAIVLLAAALFVIRRRRSASTA